MSDTFVYDKAKYHMTGVKGGAPSWEHASGTALFMLRWCIEHDLISSYFLEGSGSSLADYRSGRLSLFELYEKECDMVFAGDMLSDEGNAFARDYFEYEHGLYLKDLMACLKLGKWDYPLYTDEAYLLFKPQIDSRYADWKAGKIDTVRQPPKKGWVKLLWKIAGFVIVILMLVGVFLFIWLLQATFAPK